jgi:hypothetical protein
MVSGEGRDSSKVATTPSVRSRNCHVGHMSPCSIMGATTPKRSNMSSVGG